MNNYEYCVDWAARQLEGRAGARVLDYGCGGGEIVSLLRARGIEAYGCDVFYEGGDYSSGVQGMLDSGVIRRMHGDEIPFEAGYFDLVLSNQVFEHVADLDRALTEVSRVLKPDGSFLALFPDRGVWREGHCGIPFLHWFPKRSSGRVYYALALRSLGLGRYTEGKTRMQWSRDFCDWLDKWTYYRSLPDIRSGFLSHFETLEHREPEWLQARLEHRQHLVRRIPRSLQSAIASKLAGRVIVAGKPARGRADPMKPAPGAVAQGN